MEKNCIQVAFKYPGVKADSLFLNIGNIIVLKGIKGTESAREVLDFWRSFFFGKNSAHNAALGNVFKECQR